MSCAVCCAGVPAGDKPKQDLVAAPAADGTVRHRVGLDEQLVPRASVMPGPQVGKVMAVVAGPHAGLLCLVKEVLPTAQGSTGGLHAWQYTWQYGRQYMWQFTWQYRCAYCVAVQVCLMRGSTGQYRWDGWECAML